MSGSGKKQVVGYQYHMGIHMCLCAGPVDSLLEIKAGDRTAWTGNVTASGQQQINAPSLFGGESREGGLVGALDIMMGEAAQQPNAYLQARQGTPQPAYRGVLGVVFRQGLIATNNPYIKPWAFKVRRILQGWQGTTWYSAKAAITLPNNVGQAANPAHIVYECLTNTEWGMGYTASLINDANFRAAADTFFAEGMGLCLQWLRQQPIEQFIQQVVDHAGAVLAQDRRTGLFLLKLLRADYNVNNLQLFNESNVLSLDSYQRPALPEAINEITVQYDDIVTGKQGSVTVQNLANITSQGGVVTQGRNYPGLPTASLALRVAMRDLRSVSSPIARVRMRVNRQGYNLQPGDVIRLSWTKLGVVNLVLRVLRVNAGNIADGAVEIEASEDVYGLPASTYAAQPGLGWVSPNNNPQIATQRVVGEATYLEVLRALGASDTAALDATSGFVYAAAVRPTSDSLDFAMRTRVGSAAYDTKTRGAFCPSGTLTAQLTAGATSATIDNMADVDLVKTGTFAQIGTELVRIDAINAQTGAMTIGRGVAGTVAKTHALGTRVYFRDGGFTAYEPTERVDGELVNIKLLPATGLGELAENNAPFDSVTLDQRFFRPYPPGRVRVNNLAYPTSLGGVQPAITWAHRNRLQQNLEGDDSNNIGPEAGTLYTIELRRGDTNALLTSAAGLSTTNFTPAQPLVGAFPLRVVLWSTRGSLESTQRHDFTFDYASSVAGGANGVTLTAVASLVLGLPRSEMALEITPMIRAGNLIVGRARQYTFQGVDITGTPMPIAYAPRVVTSNDGGATWQAAATTESPGYDQAVGVYYAALSDGTYLSVYSAGITNFAGQIKGNANTITTVPAVRSENDSGVLNSALTNGYPRTDDNKLLHVGALASDGTYFYVVGRLGQQTQPASKMYLYRAGANASFTSLGELTLDPADPNYIDPSNAANYGDFHAREFTSVIADGNPSTAFSTLKRIDSRWWLIGKTGAYYTDTDPPLSGWRRAPVGLGEPTQRAELIDIVQSGTTLVAIAGRVSGTNVAVSTNNGQTWTAYDVGTYLIGGVAWNNQVIVYFPDGGLLKAAVSSTPFASWSVQTCTLTVDGVTTNMVASGQAATDNSLNPAKFQHLTQSGGRLVGVTSKQLLVYSTDGVNWTKAPLGA